MPKNHDSGFEKVSSESCSNGRLKATAKEISKKYNKRRANSPEGGLSNNKLAEIISIRNYLYDEKSFILASRDASSEIVKKWLEELQGIVENTKTPRYEKDLAKDRYNWLSFPMER